MTSRPLPDPRRRRFVALAVPGLLAAALLTAAPAAAASADEPIDGARTSNDPMFPNVGNGGYDALDYDVAIAWTPNAAQSGSTIAGTIAATSTMTATAPQPLKSFSLDFEGLDVDSVTVDGVDAAWTRDVDPAAIKYKLVVTPATPVSGEFEVAVAYHGTPSSHTDLDGSSEGWNRTSDGATLLGQPIGMMTGYPHNNTPADKATYTFTLDIPTILNNVAGTAPAEAAAVSNGELVSKTASTDGARTTWVWEQTKPMASELAVISIGRYDVIRSDFVLSDGSTIPSWSFMDFALSAANKNTIRTREAQLGTIIRNLETLYGPYPGRSTGVIVDTVPSGINYALETQDRSFFPSAGSVGGNTLIHELVHQWYGDNVSPITWTDIWINEGMATWGPAYYNSSEGFGTGATPTELTYFNSWNNSAASSPNWSVAPGAQTDSSELYEYQTYTRGAQFWAALRVAIGDQPFFALIEEWQTRHGGTSRSGADLKALAEELSGRDLTAFYADWILEGDKPAWPEKLTASLASVPASGVVRAGDVVAYTLGATNTGRVPLASSVVAVDVAGVLAQAAIDPASLPAGATLEGSTLTWEVPATPVGAPAASISFAATVKAAAPGGQLTATATVATLGGTCADCTSTLSVARDAERPTATLVAPVSAGPFPSLSVRVDATDNAGLQRIVANIYRDGALVKSTQTAVPGGAKSGTHTATVQLPDGSYTVKYNSQDLIGNISTTSTFAFTIDATKPTVTVKDGASFTVATGASYDVVSYKLFDAGKVDRVVINGKVKDLSDNQWSDVNYLKPGVFGAVRGENTMLVYDVAGNVQTVVFTLN
ncbi:Peptidase family M1 [Agromyces sp. CF514]|uniref:M1 family aminopeptidase n=1 Tax=Agromyces sp. CF514 TaxID=1881031 RepID=UPI0008E2EA28|nr:M1 family aminopeptidase [Agromyces sp. CF514]SFR70659.1 Peptidase family M1 [Agromyces sp. CF514]